MRGELPPLPVRRGALGGIGEVLAAAGDGVI